MLDVDFTTQKTRSVIHQIGQLKSAEFPYAQPKAALDLLEALFVGDLKRLAALDAATDVKVRQQVCAHANANIAKYHDRLGFLLRSTNVRNQFEVYDPLLFICAKVYGPEAKLVLSSEWSFSPFTYPAVSKDLPDLMFIGLPASEAGNALIVPLAGHELGHSVWRRPSGTRKSVSQPFILKLQNELTKAYTANWQEFQRTFGVVEKATELLTNLFLRKIWAQSFRLAERQTEELFCDLLGLRIFGDGFLYSFLYVLSPNLGERAAHYPSLSRRVEAMIRACAVFGTDVPNDFASYFSEPSPNHSAQDAFILKMADVASGELINDLIAGIEADVAACGLAHPSNGERDRIAKQFDSLSPAANVVALGDVINAGWQIRLNLSRWDAYEFGVSTATTILNDLVLKTIEVFEYESRMKEA